MIAKMVPATILLVGAVVTVTACGGNRSDVPTGQTATAPATPSSAAEPATEKADESEAPLPPSELETGLPPAVRDRVLRPFTGDLEQMAKRRLVRIGVTYNRTMYFVDKGVQRGVAYDYG